MAPHESACAAVGRRIRFAPVKNGSSLAEPNSIALSQPQDAVARSFVLHLGFLAIGLGVVFRSMLFSGFRLMHVNTGDTRLVNFILEHSYRWVLAWLSLHPISLWNQPFFFPTANVGAYSEILLGSAPIYWLFRVAQFAPDTSFQLWMMAVLTLDYFAMIVFLRNCLGFRAFSSTVGALLFAFASPRLAQMDHQQLLPQFFTVFALYGLFRFFRPARMSSAQGIHLFFLGSVLQLWAGFYLGWFLFFG